MMKKMKTIMKHEDFKAIDQLNTFLSVIQALVSSIMNVKNACYPLST